MCVFPYILCKLFWQDCALHVYRLSYQFWMYHVSAQGRVDECMTNVHIIIVWMLLLIYSS